MPVGHVAACDVWEPGLNCALPRHLAGPAGMVERRGTHTHTHPLSLCLLLLRVGRRPARSEQG
eukprot:1950186-Rhodomonas_salina.2